MLENLDILSEKVKVKFSIDLENNLFDNRISISLDKAKEINSKYILNWKWRICQKCSKDFNILNEGIYYICEECL